MLERLIQRRPVLTAAALYALVVSLAFWRFWAGGFLVNGRSDMFRGYPARAFAAEYLKTQGEFPHWDPHIFGGMPFLANTAHGDTFYPTFLLRLIFPVDIGISLGFMLHIVLAGTFMFMFLRALKLDWGASFVGGSAYLFTGQVVSMVSPGHDGKLFVSALLPLALMFVYQAVTRADWRRYLAFGVVVGFALLSPHFQMTYYLLMAAGFFWAYLVFLHPPEQVTRPPWWRHTLLFAAGLATAFAFAAIQLVPFIAYIPFTPRGEGGASRGWEHAISWSMPPEELLNVVWPAFSGLLEAYWGRNYFKLHSEYIGAAALILACFAFRLEGRQRLAWFFVFLGVYGVLFALGGFTPFYHLPYALLPGIKLTRAPSSIFVVASFAAAALAALGTQALGTAPVGAMKRTPLIAWAIALGVGVLLAASGFWDGMMRGLARDPAAVGPNLSMFTLDTVRALAVGGIVLALIWQRLAGKMGGAPWALGLGAVVLVDLWSVERHYIRFSPRPDALMGGDQVLAHLRTDTGLFRVTPGSNLLSLGDIRSAQGYSGTQMYRYDELLGRQGDAYANEFHPNVLRLLGVRYLMLGGPTTHELLIPVDSQPLASQEGARAPVSLPGRRAVRVSRPDGGQSRGQPAGRRDARSPLRPAPLPRAAARRAGRGDRREPHPRSDRHRGRGDAGARGDVSRRAGGAGAGGELPVRVRELASRLVGHRGWPRGDSAARPAHVDRRTARGGRPRRGAGIPRPEVPPGAGDHPDHVAAAGGCRRPGLVGAAPCLSVAWW